MIALKINMTTNQKLILTATNSLIYEIKIGNVYKAFSSDKEMFDFSNYPRKSKCYDNWKRLVIGKMKD